MAEPGYGANFQPVDLSTGPEDSWVPGGGPDGAERMMDESVMRSDEERERGPEIPGSQNGGQRDTDPQKPVIAPATAPVIAPATAPGTLLSPAQSYQLRKFFVLRPGTMEQAIADISALLSEDLDGELQSVWLLTEIDHWDNEKERVAVISTKSLLICKYDFMMLTCTQYQRIPLNYIDRINTGSFTAPERTLNRREGSGMRIHWDKLREASVMSRWNPWSSDMPYTTFTQHPAAAASDRFSRLCQLKGFSEALVGAVRRAYQVEPIPGRANGVLVLSQPILIETYMGLMSLINNQNKLGYSLARGNVGF